MPRTTAPAFRADAATQSSAPVNYRMKLMTAVNSMPPLPSILNQLLGMLSNDLASAGQVAQIIERDSVLSGSVLRCVNSAFYALPGRVSSIRQAVTLLGFPTVRNLALAFSMRRMMAGSQPSMKSYSSYSKHALGCAIMSQFLALYKRSADLDAAFAAGLFHDVGKLLILTTVPDVVPQVVERWEQGDVSYVEAEAEILEVTHPELSGVVLETWKLPDNIRDAGRFHHEPDSFPTTADAEGPNLAQIVYAADLAVNYLGHATIESKHEREAPDAAFERLGLANEQQDLIEKFEAEFANLGTAFR